LKAICRDIRLLRAVCYRPLFLSEVYQDNRLSSVYFKWKIVDVTHRILRLIISRWVKTEVVTVDLSKFIYLVNEWIYLFYEKIEKASTQLTCAQNKTELPALFGSKVIDLLESISECEKDVTVNTDSGGWCYIKGEYKFLIKFPPLFLSGVSGNKPLTVEQQAKLLHMLFRCARFGSYSLIPFFRRYIT
jgi:hypothetical protein